MATKLMRRRGPDLVAIHEILSLSTIVALVVHGASLLGDQFLRPAVADIAIPFASGYQTVWTSTGIIAGGPWAARPVLLRPPADRVGAVALVHRLTILAWVAGLPLSG